MSLQVYPVLRKGELLMPKEDLIKSTARKLATKLRKNWCQNSSLYKQELEKIPDLSVRGQEDDTSRIVEEGYSAFVVDHPVMVAKWMEYAFEIRIITAVCYKKSSTKNWSRVAVQNGINKEDRNFDQLNQMSKRIADVCCDVSQRIFENILLEVQKQKPTYKGNMTVFTFGITDENLDQQLNTLDNIGLSLKDLMLKNKSTDKILSDYYRDLFGLDKSTLREDTGSDYWLTSPIALEDDEGFLVGEKVLYRIKDNGKSLIAYGLGHSDIDSEQLARFSSLKIARFFASDL